MTSDLGQCFFMLRVEAWDYQLMVNNRQFTFKKCFVVF